MKNNNILVSKERLNYILDYISKDNTVYGLIFKMTYIYGRNIGEVLNVRKKDIDTKHNIIDFKLPSESISFPLHENIQETLLQHIKQYNPDDLIFIDDNVKPNVVSKRLNFYLSNIIKELNHNVFISHCPRFVCTDLKNLRGQHLFMDGCDINTLNDLFKAKNMYYLKENINYNELVKMKFPCNNINKIFKNHTNLKIYELEDYENINLYNVEYNDVNFFIEFDGDSFIVLDEVSDDIKSKLDVIVDNYNLLSKLKPGQYTIISDFKIIKN